MKILCCPETHQPLAEASAELVATLNQRIQSGKVCNRAGEPVQQAVDSALVREDRQWLYPIRQNIPVLLIDEAIPMSAAA
ncbi:MAG: hypothetical protein AB1813_04965 [Verrucomicrobiota bacterium]